MNENTLIVVHCYEGDADQVKLFMPYFLHHERPVLILSPEDAPVQLEYPGVTCASAGRKGWKGRHTLWRQQEHWRLALEQDAEWFLLNDADSLCLTPQIPEYLYSDPMKFWCNVLCHEWEHQEDDHPNLNPPYFMNRDVLAALLKRSEEIESPDVDPEHDHSGDDPGNPVPCDLCYWQAIDGFYTNLVINDLRIPYENFPDGATTWPRGWGEMLDHVEAHGARMLHGMKDGTSISMLQWAYNSWEVNQRLIAEGDEHGFYEGQTIRVTM